MTRLGPSYAISGMRTCPSCGHVLDFAYFQGGRCCDNCRDAAAAAVPWSADDLAYLDAMISNVLTWYVTHFDNLTEPECEVFRKLLDAKDRRRWRTKV
jgi:hypothetical protein